MLHASFGASSSDGFGAFVSDAGDVDGDCVPDVIASASGNYARVLSGSTGTSIFTVTGINVGAVAGAGDVDRDGAADVVVGEPDVSSLVMHEIGRATVYAGLGGTVTPYCGPANPNSTGAPAVISTRGSMSVANNCLVLAASALPPGQVGYFLASLAPGLFSPPGSAGLLCLGGNIGRFNQPPNIGQGPTFSIQIDLTAIPQPAGIVAGVPGDTWNFQCWYRDVGNTNNFTDAVSVTFQ